MIVCNFCCILFILYQSHMVYKPDLFGNVLCCALSQERALCIISLNWPKYRMMMIKIQLGQSPE